MGLWQTLILGIIQGATEFLPVSSSGHLVIIGHFFKNFYRPGILYEILLHLATLVAIVIYYRKDLINIYKAIFSHKADSVNQDSKSGCKLAKMILVGTIPTFFIGFLFNDLFQKAFSNIFVALISLMLTGLLLWFADRVHPKSRTIDDMKIKDALAIGFMQGIAITPGISRSGATIAMGIFLGLDLQFAAKYSFLLSILAILGASALHLNDFYLLFDPRVNILYMLIGAGSATIVGYLCIIYLIKLLTKRKLTFFAYYCWALSLGILGIIYLIH